MIKIVIPIEPVEQARPRAVRTGFGVRLYDPSKVKRYKQDLARIVRAKYRGLPLDGALSVDLWVYRHIQASLSKKRTCTAAVRGAQANS